MSLLIIYQSFFLVLFIKYEYKIIKHKNIQRWLYRHHLTLYSIKKRKASIPAITFSWCRPDTYWPSTWGCPPWGSGTPACWTGSRPRWWRARRRTCWRSSGTCPARRRTRWRAWRGSPSGRSRGWRGPGRRPRLRPRCAREIGVKSEIVSLKMWFNVCEGPF